MIIAKINSERVKLEVTGTPAEIMSDLHNLIDSIIPDLAGSSNGTISKEHLLTILYQNLLKEWSE